MGRLGIFIGTCLLALFGYCGTAYAKETEITDSFLEQLQLEDIDETLEEVLGESDFHFLDSVKKLMEGEIPFSMEAVGDLLFQTFFSELGQHKKNMVHILVLIIASAIFTNFANVFDKSQVADISFYMMYLLLFTILMKAFYSMSQLTLDTVNHVLIFMKVLLPTYFLAAAFASGSMTGAAFYEMTLLLVTLIQWLLKYAVIPAVNFYVIFTLLNHLTKEEYLSKMAELLKTLVGWLLKTLLAAAIGFQTVQYLILPAVDGLKTTILNKAAGSIPGVGNVFNGVTEVVLASAILIKNAVGVAGLLVLLLICMAPLLKLGVCALLYKLMAAVIQPVTDKRMIECVSGVGEGAGMLLKIMLTAGALFFISLAMATASIRGV